MDLNGHYYAVQEIRGEDVPTWLIYKNGRCYALVEQLDGSFRFAGDIGSGAETIDPKLADHVFRLAG
jgi:hypothetical protein